jgi:predicted ester cyclase
LVATRITATAKHNGPFQGIAPTGKSVHTTGLVLHRVKDGLITEEWTEFDMLGLLQQIGAVPELVHDEG